MRGFKFFKAKEDLNAFLKDHAATKHNKKEHHDLAKWMGVDEKEYPYSLTWFMDEQKRKREE